MSSKPRIPKGTRDFNSQQIAKREYIFNIIKSNFNKFGFTPIETPSFELSETLLGKYGNEGDRLIFKILNSGEKVKKADLEALKNNDFFNFSNSVSEKALRYDLTVPFARYVVQNQNEITFPFKRYQIQPVWRADRPQRGRFQEFYQCDADVVGSKSLLQEIEFIQLYDSVFSDLKLDGVSVKINNRKILLGIAELIGADNKITDFTVALDKLDKIGIELVKDEMLKNGISSNSIETMQPIFDLSGDFNSKLDSLKTTLIDSEIGKVGISELEWIFNTISELGLKKIKFEFDVTLARGLNYYTGSIIEVSPPKEVSMGSIGGGGRYDDLTGIFGLKGVSGVGISFGLDRIALILEELGLFPNLNYQSTQILFSNFGSQESVYCLKSIQKLRDNGIISELYPDAVKLKKQISYANKKDIPYVALVGDEEIKQNKITLKKMSDGSQKILDINELIKMFA
jgi:histidyl-tRNA synthetase